MKAAAAGISVIIPAYNAARFVGDAIESVRAQDLRPAEVIVVDDGSDDDTKAVVDRYPEVSYLRRANGGPAAARNSGLAVATGSLIAFQDADDLMKPTRLRDQSNYLAEHPEIHAVLGRQEIELMDGTPAPGWTNPDQTYGDPGGIQMESMMIRAESIRRIGGFDPDFLYAQGQDILFRMRDEGMAFAVMDKVIITRRVHATNLSHDTGPMTTEIARAVRDHHKRTRGTT